MADEVIDRKVTRELACRAALNLGAAMEREGHDSGAIFAGVVDALTAIASSHSRPALADMLDRMAASVRGANATRH